MKRGSLFVFALVLLCSSRALALGLCTVSTVTVMNFGAYDPFSSTPRDSTAQVTVGCLSLLSTQTISIQLSKGSSNTYAARTMQQGGYALQYNIYLDSNRTVIFGDGTGGSSVDGPYAPSILVLGSYTLTLYGRIFARQNVPAGIYNDTLTVTVNF